MNRGLFHEHFSSGAKKKVRLHEAKIGSSNLPGPIIFHFLPLENADEKYGFWRDSMLAASF
ncbi:hypothetical protein AKJ58_01115 [candidate division MSBL1 archaeon SCGC-AAA385D11]|uniref:Uncharacterized protein n=1 Tax=candidate division MSBL1 archaeon SCGC-AAA385D11 TaxID=1698286 RepID=A0A133VNK6_9EURY|nr:hypothetical protein AKJ58_01115 [candidate division MSBL1 archaeon SCGC-AAA385D11]